MPSEEGLTCRTCLNTREWHQENKSIHPFNNGDSGAAAFLGPRRARDPKPRDSSPQRGSETPPTMVWPTDPVLRVALMNAGVITADHLRVAEEQLRAAMGGVIMRGGQDGQGEVQIGAPAKMDVGQRPSSGEEVGA